MYLYRFLKNYDRQQFQAMVVTEKYFPLFDSLQPDVQYAYMSKHRVRNELKKVWRTVSHKLKNLEKPNRFGLFIEDVHRHFKPDYWVLNTILMQKVMPSALHQKAKTISIIHEMPSAYSFVSVKSLKSLIEHSHSIISNSSATSRAISIMGRDDVKLQPCFFDANEIVLNRTREEVRSELGIRSDEFVLIGSGSIDPNKGIELFLQICEIAENKNWKFIWIGGERTTGFNYYAFHYLDQLKTKGNLIVLDEKEKDYFEYLDAADAFLLPSFSESFSLATLEALALGKPVIAYNCGGVNDFLTEQCGFVLDSRAPKDWIDTISLLQQRYGQFNQSELKSIANQYRTEKQVPALTALLSSTMPS